MGELHFWVLLVGAGVPLAAELVGILLVFIGRATVWRDPERGIPIVAEYRPQDGIDIATAAVVLRQDFMAGPALLLDHVVRGDVALLRAPTPTGFVFSIETASGERMLAWQYLDRVCEPEFDRAAEAATALRSKPEGPYMGMIACIVFGSWAWSAVGGVIAFFWLGAVGWAWLAVAAAAVSAALGITLTVLAGKSTPLTAEGREAYRHLLGLRDYIQTAEVLRLDALQAPKTALATPAPAPGSDPRTERLDVRDRLLPYSVLFHPDDRWRRAFAKLTWTNPNETR